AIVALQEVEAAPDAAQHAEREHVDLHQAERIDVVLVPLEEGAIVHGGVADRHRVVEPLAGEHAAADVLGEMAREAGPLVRERRGLAERRTSRLETGVAAVSVRQALAIAPYGLGERRGHIGRQTERLADLAYRAAGAIVHDGGADRGAVPSITLIDVLDHL